MKRAFGNCSRKYWNNLWGFLCCKFLWKGSLHVFIDTPPLHPTPLPLLNIYLTGEADYSPVWLGKRVRGWCVSLPLYQNLTESAFLVIFVLEWRRSGREKTLLKDQIHSWEPPCRKHLLWHYLWCFLLSDIFSSTGKKGKLFSFAHCPYFRFLCSVNPFPTKAENASSDIAGSSGCCSQ